MILRSNSAVVQGVYESAEKESLSKFFAAKRD